MATKAPIADAPVENHGREGDPLGFALNFISGRGLLTTRDKGFGPLELRLLELEIPNISFPFDVTGGAHRFKNRHCVLRHLVFGVSGEGLSRAIRGANLADFGFAELKTTIRDGYVEFSGRFKVGEHQADFTFRAALLVRSHEEVLAVFYDSRVYGWLPVPSGLLPVYLRRALDLSYLEGDQAGAWVLRPGRLLLRQILPRSGWKIPDLSQSTLVAAECARGRVIFAAGPEHEPSPRQVSEREAPVAAVRAAEGMTQFMAAEQALFRGDIRGAYDRFRDAVDDERGGPWARERLLQIGASDPELSLDTRQLAEEALARNERDIQALLALAAIAFRESSWGDASERFSKLAEIARANKSRADSIAAELAAAQAAAPIDPGGALAAYERAAARARDSVIAHEALFRLRRSQGDWKGAAQAGERLIKLVTDPRKRAPIHRELGLLCRSQLADLRRARMHYERALRLTPDDPGALEGLAETYAARGEPARAASYLARLAEQAEASGEQDRIVALNLRLGEIWERWLGDPESAETRYHRVLDADPNNRPARLRLAELAEARGDTVQARSLYEDVLAAEEEGGDPEVIPDLVAAYTRLARVTLAGEGPSGEAVACLERAVELDPRNRSARQELARLLRERGEWGRLLTVYEEALQVGADHEEARLSHLYAARIEIEQRRNPEAAVEHLERILDAKADDGEALELLLPILEAQRDAMALSRRLAAAADATPEPLNRARFLYLLAQARQALGQGADARVQPLENALAANPYHLDAAVALVDLLEEGTDYVRLVAALDRLGVAATTEQQRADALLRRGELVWRKLRRTREAEATLREALAIDSARAEGWLVLADLLADRGEHQAAQAVLDEALQVQTVGEGNPGPIHRRLAELARGRNDAQEESVHLQAAIERGVRDEEIFRRLASVLGDLGRQQEVAELFEQWARDDVEEERVGPVLLQAADTWRILGHEDRAAQLYHEIVGRRDGASLAAAEALERVAREHDDLEGVAQALEFQLQLAPNTERGRLLAALLRTYETAQDASAAEETSRLLIDFDPGAYPAHAFLAQQAQQRRDYTAALNHYATVIKRGDPKTQRREERHAAFVRAAALAHEVRPDLVKRVKTAFRKEFPHEDPASLDVSLGKLFAQSEDWGSLLELRRTQLESAQGDAAVSIQLQIGQILHERLSRLEDAVPYYEAVWEAHPGDRTAREALASIFRRLERFDQLGALLQHASEVAESAHEALGFGLQCAQIFAQKARLPQHAEMALGAVIARPDVDVDSETLLGVLRDLGLKNLLVDVRSRSLQAKASADDGRFAELMGLLTDLDRGQDALSWCRWMIEHFPESDVPRRALVDLTLALPEVGETSEALEQWAEARTGSARAQVLYELSRVFQEEGSSGRASAALVRAAEADPQAVDVLQQLIHDFAAANDWPHVLQWQERLAEATPAESRDEAYRELFRTALRRDVGAFEVAARALTAVHARTEDETRLLGRLHLELGSFNALATISGVRSLFDEGELLRAGRGLAEAGDFEQARAYFDEAFTRVEDRRTVWAEARETWAQAGRLEELGRWRIAWAQQVPKPEAAYLRLLGFAELVEGGASSQPEVHGVTFDAECSALDWSDAEHLWALFLAAQSAERPDWRARAARRLEGMLPVNDPRAVAVLRVRVEEELADGNADAAVELARGLLQHGADDADDWLERALTEAGRDQELISFLTEKAEMGDPKAATMWTRVAGLHAQRQEWSEVVRSLDRVDEEARAKKWSVLRYEAGRALQDPQMEVDGAQRSAKLTEAHAEKARWLRAAAHRQWWGLQEEPAARATLQEAQTLHPVAADEVMADVELAVAERKLTVGIQALEEALAVLDDGSTASLWVELGRLCCAEERSDRATEAVHHAVELIGDDASLWGRAGAVAERLGDLEIARRAYDEAFSREPAVHEEAYLRTLEHLEQWSDAVTLLESRAASLSDEAAAERLVRAATLARDQVVDAEKALDLFSRAMHLHPEVETMLATFELAVALRQLKVLAALGDPLLGRLADDDPRRPDVLRSVVDAMDHLQLDQEAEPLRRELLRRGLAESRDKRALARLNARKHPETAARLMAEAAREAPEGEQAEYYVDAAFMWHESGRDDQAEPLLTQAIEMGSDSVNTHRLALRLFSGQRRLESAARLISLDGDAGWDAEHRAALRCELAEARLAAGDAEDALALLTQAQEFARLPNWPRSMESVLIALDRKGHLAELWVAEAKTERPTWDSADMVKRLAAAADIFRSADSPTSEIDALELILEREPKNTEVRDRLASLAAELGDRDQFLRQIKRQLEEVDTAADRGHMVLRYAPVLEQRFDDREGALEMLRHAFSEAPTLALADAIRGNLVASQQAEQAVDILLAHVEAIAQEDAAALLLQAAELATTLGGDGSRAYSIYRKVLDREPANEPARFYCLDFATGQARWSEAVEVLTLAARGMEEPSSRFGYLVEAADMAKDHLEDPALERALIQEAVEAVPTHESGATRLLELQLDAGDVAAAAHTLTHFEVERSRQVDLAVDLARQLREQSQPDKAEEVLVWMVHEHPHSLAASDYRIDKARSGGADEALYQELAARIDHPATFDEEEKAVYHAEAGLVALRLGQEEAAYGHLITSLRAPQLEAAVILQAARLADRRSDVEAVDRIIERAVAMREALEAAAAESAGGERTAWYVLLGRVHEVAGDEDAAITAHSEAIASADRRLPPGSLRALAQAYTRRGQWQELVALYSKARDLSGDAGQQAEFDYQIGKIWRDHLGDEKKAEEHFVAVLRLNPNHDGAQIAQGFILCQRGQYAQALPFLIQRIDVHAPETPFDHLVVLLECLRQAQEYERAFMVAQAVLDRDPSRIDMLALQAELLEALERHGDAEGVWMQYADALGHDAPPEELAPIRQRLAHAALRREDPHGAIAQLEEAHRLQPDVLQVVHELRRLYERVDRWEDAAGMRQLEAQSSETSEARLEHYRELARIYRELLHDPVRALDATEKALVEQPDDVPTLQALLALQEQVGDYTKMLVAGERLLVLMPEADQDSALLQQLARAYTDVANKPARALELYRLAARVEPDNVDLMQRVADLARQTGDYRAYTEVEEVALSRMDADDPERVTRARELAEVYLSELDDVDKATQLLQDAHAAQPHDRDLLRQLADTYALDAQHYQRAGELYQKMLAEDPLEPDVIRLLARLAGQSGETDRAYGLYASLLALQPRDEEARKFVDACRDARPAGPGREVTDDDRASGMIHTDQHGPIEDLFAPLARFAELTQPGDLNRRGVHDRDALGPTDERLTWIKQVTDPLGVPDLQVYTWRGGGYACEVELVGAPAVLLGSSVADSDNARERAFLVARSAELYRTGHTLCDRLSQTELEGLLAALCLAIEPAAKPPGTGRHTVEWAEIIGSRMTDQIRASLAPMVLSYLASAKNVSVGDWRRSCLCTATRTAMLLSCDIEESINAMLRLRGFDDITDDQRPAVLRESPEELDLFRFSLSDAYFRLRQALGLALRRA